MKCRDIMSKRLETLSETDTIARAAIVMKEAQVGFLPICGADRKVIGVVTDRDLVTRGLASALEARTTSAAMIMTAPAVTCLADADLRAAEELMARERRSRLVLTNDDGTIAGVLSVVDLVERAPGRETLATLKSLLWREALGPRGGAAPGQRLLKDDPLSAERPESERVTEPVFVGGRHDLGTKEFPS
ncbi:MAG TPA: CBS domain-containing protein [Polyangia bacterium]|nr:CBS domain-containing protein [Polyangia bacterium]